MKKILLFFKYHGYDSNSQISLRQLENIIAFNTDPFEELDPLPLLWKKSILDEAWSSSDPDHYQRVVISRFVYSIFQIHYQLKSQINLIRKQISRLKTEIDQTNKQIISRVSEHIQSSQNDQDLDLFKSKILNLSYLVNNYEEECKILNYKQSIILRQFQRSLFSKPCVDLDNQSSTHSHSHDKSVIEPTQEHSHFKVYNKKLRILFFLSCSFIVVEIFVMFLKYSSLDLMIGFLLLSIFLFSCFHHSYIKIMLMMISCSFIFDIGWVVGKAYDYWFPNKFSVYSDIDPKMHRLIILFIAVQTIHKGAIGYYLWPWRKFQSQDVYYVKTFGNCDLTLKRSQAKIKLQQKLVDEVFCGLIY